MIRLVAVLLVAALAGCASPPPRLPPAVAQARAADVEARRALQRGDLVQARALFARAVTLHQALDDENGAAVALLSQAAVSHRLHDDAAALQLLDQLVNDAAGMYPADARINAAFRKAVILTDLGRTDDATQVLSQAAWECAQKCATRYGIAVLQARLAWLRGDTGAALQLAQPVAAGEGASNEERANAWRIVAAAEEAGAQYDAAVRHYQTALELDKLLGLSARIERDLAGISRALAHLGRAGEAARYARRASLVRAAAQPGVPAAAVPRNDSGRNNE